MKTHELITSVVNIDVTTAELAAEAAKESEHTLFIRAILMLSLILLSMNINGMLHKIKFHYLSETAVTIILGVIAALAWTTISYDSTNADIQLNSDFFYMVLLPPIIFEGGYTLQRVSFFSNILTILSLAFAGALFSTFVCSALMYLFSQWVYPWTFIESLVFGSLISSTDPVTVLSLLPSSVDRRLYMIIFGESALNDAVAIILYRFFTGFADPTAKLGIGPFITSVFASAAVFFGSFLVGIFIALVFAKITKHFKIEEGSVYEVTMLILFAYISYLLADVLGLTGIISIFFCGIAMAHYAAGNLSEEARKASKVTLRLFAFVCETFIFLYLGLGLLSFGSKASYDPLMIIFACVAILVSRAHVFIILGLKNLLLKHQTKDGLQAGTTTLPVPMNQQILIWFSGLRGAVAFALGVTFLEQDAFTEEAKASIFGTTVMVVVLTVLVIGGLTPYMLVWLGICDGEHDEESAAEQQKDLKQLDAEHGKEHGGGENDGDDQEFDEEEFNRNAENKSVFVWLRNLDDNFIRPYFSRTAEAVDTFVPKALFPRASLPPELEPKRKSTTARMSESYRSLKKKSVDMGLDGDLGLSRTSGVQKNSVPAEEAQATNEEKKFMIE
ncbi:Sodium/hydrogen exchanger 8 [Entophlyctis sp. JEL0112]|nr:Sodium/hydrogen exchanger 8 [Entophlyctis sp. JEL0112]